MKYLGMVFAGLVGCSNADDPIPASGLAITLGAEVTDGSLHVVVTFMDPNGYSYRLHDNETLTATTGDRMQIMGDSSLDFFPNYEATFDDVTSTDLTITLERPGETVTSTAQLPTPFAFTSVPTTASRGADLAIDYDAPGIAGEISQADISAPCLTEIEIPIDPDTGELVVPAATLQAPGSTQTCTATITLTRLPPPDTTQVDPAFFTPNPGWTVSGHASAMFKTQP